MTARERMQQRDQEQSPSYNEDEYHSEYYEGVRRNKQGREETWEQKEQRLEEEQNKKTE